MPLNENFRSTQPIVDLCGTLCNQGPIVGRPKNKEDSQTKLCSVHVFTRQSE